MNKFIRHGHKMGLLMSLALVIAVFALLAMPQPATAATTELTITKYAVDGKTVLDQMKVDYRWLMDEKNIGIMGDGETRYYHQGPVFKDDPDPDMQELLRWNEEEDQNWDVKDMGAVKGNNVKDLCELVGGMAEGDTLQIQARDGLKKTFAYKNVYQYEDREGPMVVCWYQDGKYPDSGYNDGMRLVWFAAPTYKTGPTTLAQLPSGYYHVFGNWDWRVAADPEYWYYYNGEYPTTTGLSVQFVSKISIYSNESVAAPPALNADTDGNEVGQAVDIAFTDDAAWRAAISRITVDGREIAEEQYSISEGKITIDADVFTNVGEYIIAVSAKGYSMATVTQAIVEAQNVPVAAFSADKTSGQAPLTVQFSDESTGTPTSWAWDFDNDGQVDSTEQNPSYEYTVAGTYSVKLTVTNDLGSDEELKEGYVTVTPAGAQTWYVDDSGESDFVSIQEAVTAANAGDTIIVKDGTYTENVTIDKSLVIRSENGTAQTIVQTAAANVDVFKVTAESVTVDGFTVSGATSTGKSGIVLTNSCTSCNIMNNHCTGNSQGISVSGTNNTVSNNTCTSSGRYGIYLFGATGNSITGNTLSNNTDGSGYALYVADNADNNSISNNVSDSNKYGIRVKAADSNTFFNNTISNNDTGMELATKPVGNVFYLNNFIDNTTQLSEGFNGNTENSWNSSTELTYTYKGSQYSSHVGNYWSNYDGTDNDGDGIGDSPYATIASYKDNYPLMGAWQDGAITAPADAPVAAFTADQASGTAPLTVKFTDQSTNEPTAWEWDFDNDGDVDSTEQNPSYQYTAPGTYTVKLTVTNSAGSDEETKADYITVSTAPVLDVLYEGPVALSADETFTVTIAEKGYTVKENTPLGALQKAAIANGFSYKLSDKKYADSGVLLLDDIGTYPYQKSGNQWFAYVNGVFKDGYEGQEYGLNIIELVDNDTVEFYYVPKTTDANDLDAVQAAAAAAVKTVVVISTMDVLYQGPVALSADETFTVTIAEKGYTVKENTPLGALQKAAIAKGFSYKLSDKKYSDSGVLLLDDIGTYPYVRDGNQWFAYVNGVFKDGYEGQEFALNIIELVDNDTVEFYYVPKTTDKNNLDAVKAAATAAVLTVVDSDATTPSDWTLQLSGAKDATLTKAQFEELGQPGHRVTWTDDDGNEWGGIPLWMLVAMVDDDPDVGDNPYNFNDDLAAQGYEVKVIAGDGWSTVLASADIARSDDYIVANTLNGEPLPLKTESDKGCWPLHLKGAKIAGGQQVGNIVRIELSGLPEPPAGWTLEMVGEIGDIITQEEFEDGLACTGSGHYQEWTDNEGKVWSGVPLWVLVGTVDDIERSSHWTFNDTLADSYDVTVIAGDGNYSKTFAGADVANSNNYIVANKYDGQPLTGDAAPLRLVGDGVTKDDGSLGGSAVGNIARIEIPELQTPPAAGDSWNLTLDGKISDVISQAEFEQGLACPHSGHLVEWTDVDGNKWSGIPLWYLAGWVDDRIPHTYDYNQAIAGYKVVVKAEDGYSVDFDSQDINKSTDYIIANKCNGEALTDTWPLRLVGNGVANAGVLTGKSVGKVVEIKLTSFESGGSGTIPELRIVKYGEDGTTIIAEETFNYLDMQSRFDVIGDGTTVYKYQGVTFDPEDPWDEKGEKLNDFKIANAVKGTRIKDLCDFVGGMGAGTDIVFKASDGWETKLPYSSIYTDPSVQERQGDAILAWWGDGKYVPDYIDGMRLFFTPEDTVYSQMDMRETLPEAYWHYYGADGIMYPSCAGLSAKYITEIRVYSVPQGDWTLELDGQDIGGLKVDVSKTYFESALTCTFGANHKASYTDSENRVWEGMPLWFLVGFVDDADQHSDNAFNRDLAESGYQVIITAEDGTEVIIDSQDIDRNNNYIVANTLDGITLPEDYKHWPLRLVGPNLSGKQSIGQIVSIKLVPSESGDPAYTVTPVADAAYTAGTTPEGISTMTVNSGIAGFKYFHRPD
ncbi:MAG: PKD domain-containing protein [Syntrophomonadales bacterium]